MKPVILCSIVLFSTFSFGIDILKKENQKSYVINVSTTVEHWGMGDSETDLFLAYLKSNEYQQCQDKKIDDRAEVTPLGRVGDSCIYYRIPLGRKQAFGKKAVFYNSFELETFDVAVDFEAIGAIKPYDVCDPNYAVNIGSDLPFINVEHPALYKISEAIWQESEDILDYAEKCYLLVAKQFEYGERESGFKSLNYTLLNRKGDCGNLSSVFITLLRMQGIPARHLMGFRPDGSLHVWSDFYLQDYGWIPVDVTYKHDYPEGDYFGKIKFEHNGFIVQRGIGHQIDVLEFPKRITGLQTYTYQVSYTKEHHAKVYISRKVECVEIGG
ncbi:MAG: transglutaminase-like domain-containing protein [Crocinitomicaceae bacterium]